MALPFMQGTSGALADGIHAPGPERKTDVTDLLRKTIAQCAACVQPLDGHSYRFFSCYPDTAAASSFEAACRAGDWAAVHALQTPSVDQPHFTVYAIACPNGHGGMVALLHLDAHAGTPTLQRMDALSPPAFAALRALCPACRWIAFRPALQSNPENL